MKLYAKKLTPSNFFFYPLKVQRQHDEAVKEVNQAMTVRIKASKDLKRLTEERNAAMQVGKLD